MDDAQEESHLPIQTSDPFEQEGHHQAHPNSTQEVTVEDEPIARWTRGRLQQGQLVANKATNDGELGESAADQEHTCHLSI